MANKIKYQFLVAIVLIYIIDWLRLSLNLHNFTSILTIGAMSMTLLLASLIYKGKISLRSTSILSLGYLIISIFGLPLIKGLPESDARYGFFLEQIAQIEKLKMNRNIGNCSPALKEAIEKFDDPFAYYVEPLKFNKHSCTYYSVGPNGVDDNGQIKSVDKIYKSHCQSNFWDIYLFGKMMCYISFKQAGDVSISSFSNVLLKHHNIKIEHQVEQ